MWNGETLAWLCTIYPTQKLMRVCYGKACIVVVRKSSKPTRLQAPAAARQHDMSGRPSVGSVRLRTTVTSALLLACKCGALTCFDSYALSVPLPSFFRSVLFRQYDTDDSGAIDEREFRELAKTVNNASPMFPGNFAKALLDFDT